MKTSSNNRNTRRRRNSIDRRSPKLVVEHSYVDHYYDPVVPDDKLQQGQGDRKGPRGGVVTPFPERLYNMLSQAEPQGFEDIVSWQPHGRSFIIHQPKSFVETVMPKFFNQSKLTSFQRQVNLYGFRRLTAGKDRGAYYHAYFLRGRPDLAKMILRIRIKGTGCKSAASPETEPCFYSQYHPCLENAHGNHAVTGSQHDVSSNNVTPSQNGQGNAPLESSDYQLQDASPLKDNYTEGEQVSNIENLSSSKHTQADCSGMPGVGGNMTLLKSMTKYTKFWFPPPPPLPGMHQQLSQNEIGSFQPIEPAGHFYENDANTTQQQEYQDHQDEQHQQQYVRDALSPFPMSSQPSNLFHIQEEVISLISDEWRDLSHDNNVHSNSSDYSFADPLFMLGDSFQQKSV